MHRLAVSVYSEVLKARICPAMERAKDSRVIHGGGSGEGFKDTEHLRQETAEIRARMAIDILAHASRRRF